jgi:hypothetical protein
MGMLGNGTSTPLLFFPLFLTQVSSSLSFVVLWLILTTTLLLWRSGSWWNTYPGLKKQFRRPLQGVSSSFGVILSCQDLC